MASRSKRRAPNRTATRKPIVPRLRMTVVVHPESASRERGVVSLHREVQAIRAAILYADEIEVVSPASEMLMGVRAFAETSDAPALDVLKSLDPVSLEQLGGVNGDEMKKMVDILPLLQNPAFDAILAQHDDERVESFRRLSNELNDKMGESTRQIRDALTKLYEEAGGPEIAAATKTGVVKIKPLVRDDDDWSADTLVERYVAEITDLLTDGSRHMLLDQGTSKLANLLIREKKVEPSALVLPNALESLVGTGVVARLPTFGETPADELLDLRRDLIGPLGRYRRAVASLGALMRVGPLDSEAEAEVEHLYLTQVAPALEEMRENLAEHGLVREFANAIGANLAAVVGGGIAMPGLVVGIQAATDLATVATAGLAALPGIAGTAAVLARAKQSQREAFAGVSRNDLYYLHELDRRMA